MKIKFIASLLLCLFLTGCGGTSNDNKHDCLSNKSDWLDVSSFSCGETGEQIIKCLKCEKVLETKTITKEHQYKENVNPATCTKNGSIINQCTLCGEILSTTVLPALEHNFGDWMVAIEATCHQVGVSEKTCNLCGFKETSQIEKMTHEFDEEILSIKTCTQDGKIKYTCKHCGTFTYKTDLTEGHLPGNVRILKEPTSTHVGKKEVVCENCDEIYRTFNYVNNDYYANGKLSVNGADLVNQDGEKFQLYGLSTHGINWFHRFVNFDTICSLKETFGMNVIRIAMYTDEGGFCTGNAEIKAQMLETLHRGIDIATKLGLYVIVDWHMVGAYNVLDKNPLTYLEQSKEFFSYISEYYKDQDNILYEIMNEPNGSTTWNDCKKYANEVIPLIRKNTDAIVLVGNPRWTADLNSVMKSPLTGYENIMYTYHFYAADHRNTTQVETAYDNGFPVFISEFGFMLSSGDGSISMTNGNKWKAVLDARNISYVAWNISNSKGSASIFKHNTVDLVDVSDSNLKEWGRVLKNWYRSKAGLDQLQN